jgi:aerobic-type carbon monoxide dehydrogenase small subunit (CoxS/CutS family)
MASIKFAVDGKAVTVNADPNMPLLYALRNDLEMGNPHLAAVSHNAARAPCIWTASRCAPA